MKIAKFLAFEGRATIVCLDTKELTNYIKKLHCLKNATTIAMGRFLTISALMAHTEIKEKSDKLTLQINGGGLTGSLVSVVRIDGKKAKIKGYIQNPNVDLPKDDTKIGKIVGTSGYLNIIKNNDYTTQGYKGLSPLISGEITKDFENYFKTSNQKSTYLDADVLIKENEIVASGGYIINLMPDATEEDSNKIKNALKNSPSIIQLLKENKSLIEIAKLLTGDEFVRVLDEEIEVVYECDCSREKTIDALIAIGKKDLKTIIEEDGKASIVCHYCNKSYDFTKEDLEEILNELN